MASPSSSSSHRQDELERRFQQRKKPQLSISDPSWHSTEAVASDYFEDDPYYPEPAAGMASEIRGSNRPLSYINSPSERESFETRKQRRHATLLPASTGSAAPSRRRKSPPRGLLAHRQSNEQLPSPTGDIAPSPKQALHRMGSRGTENIGSQQSPTSPPPLSRHSSSETAVQQFPLNDIDYESSPAAVAQELSNLQAIRRMSMNVDTADPDLPSFGGGLGGIAAGSPSPGDDEDDPSKLFWVPARLHPELAPKEFKTFIEDRVEKIRRRSGDENSLSPDGLSRSGSNASGLHRKKSMLSHSIDTRGNYQDGAERLERKRSSGMQFEGHTAVSNLQDLETLVNNPSELMRRMSLDNQRRSQDSGEDTRSSEDMPMSIKPPAMGTLKRSTRTTYRRGSLKKGERVPYSKRVAQRHAEAEMEEMPPVSPSVSYAEEREPVLGLVRVQTEPIPPPKEPRETHSRSSQSRRNQFGQSHSSENLPTDEEQRHTAPQQPSREAHYDDRPVSEPPSSQQPRQFQSRIASPGRTTAQLPGYDNRNPLPQIIETLPDGSKVPANSLAQQLPERKSSHDVPRQFQRGGAHMRPVPGRQNDPASSNLDDLSSNPSPLPGSGSTRTDSLTMIPTFDEKKAEKKESSRKSSWKWILGSDDKGKEEQNGEAPSKSKAGKFSKNTTDKARLDVLQNSIDGTVPVRGRESIVLNREDIRLEEERRKDSRKPESTKTKDKDSGLLSAIFGNKKKSSDSDLKDKKKKAARHLSPDLAPRILKPDIDYNWTRFSILEERAIYRMAHIKLANPRRALYSQVLLSNFMYSYLAKVQMMHPQMQIPAQRTAQQRAQEQQKQQQKSQVPEYNQYQRWQEEQARQDAANKSSAERSSYDVHDGQRQSVDSQQGSSAERRASADEYGRSPHSGGQQRTEPLLGGNHYSKGSAQHRNERGQDSGHSHPNYSHRNGYSVASTHDYLGHSETDRGLWDDEREGDLW